MTRKRHFLQSIKSKLRSTEVVKSRCGTLTSPQAKSHKPRSPRKRFVRSSANNDEAPDRQGGDQAAEAHPAPSSSLNSFAEMFAEEPEGLGAGVRFMTCIAAAR